MRIIFTLISLFTFDAFAQSSQTFKQLLGELEKKALQIQVSENQLQANQIDLERGLTLFEPTAFVRGGYQNIDTPPTSPFSLVTPHQKNLNLESLNNGCRV